GPACRDAGIAGIRGNPEEGRVTRFVLAQGMAVAALGAVLFLVPGVPGKAAGVETPFLSIAERIEGTIARRIDMILAMEAPRLTPEQHSEIREQIVRTSLGHKIDPLFILALMRAESGFDPRAVSKQGGLGLLHLTPATAR